MRLTPYEIASIGECAARHFGEGAVVRLFGSRVRDELRGGDIDLHITAERELGSYGNPEWEFRAELEERIGERHVDVLVNGPGGPVRPIEKIAILTGIVLPERSSLGPVTPPAHLQRLEQKGLQPMADHLHREILREAIRSGTNAKAHIREALANLEPSLPIKADVVAGFDRAHRLEAESLLLNFGSLVATVQDQLIRSVLIVADEKVEGRSRLDHRHTAEKLGALPNGIDYEGMIKAGNQLAHQYPADPVKQALLVNEVIAAAETAIVAFDELAAYAERLLTKTGKA